MSFTDSDHYSSSIQLDDCLNEDNNMMENEKNHLLNQINNLTTENTILKAQFEQNSLSLKIYE